MIRKTTLNRFGPVRAVRPALVFELGFEGLPKAVGTKAASPCVFRACYGSATINRCIEANCLADLWRCWLALRQTQRQSRLRTNQLPVESLHYQGLDA